MVAERDKSGRFAPGNKVATGKPKGLAEKARAACGNGDELVAFMARVYKDEGAEMRDRIKAVEWLADRGWGKAIQTVAGDSDSPLRIRLTWGGDGTGDEPA
jgi:hypothetical protein